MIDDDAEFSHIRLKLRVFRIERGTVAAYIIIATKTYYLCRTCVPLTPPPTISNRPKRGRQLLPSETVGLHTRRNFEFAYVAVPSSASVDVLNADDVVFAGVRADLDLDEFQRDLAWVVQPVH